MTLTEFNLAILILFISDGLSMCSIWYFMLMWLSVWTPKNLWIGNFYWLTIHCDWRIINDFSLWEIKRMHFPWVKLYPPSVTQVRIWFRYFCNLRLILRIPGACAQIARSSANWERFTWASRGWGMSLIYKINRIREKGLPWGTPWMGVIGSLSWSLIEIISFLW